MDVIVEIFAYYKLGFGRSFDFSTPSSRKELNYFMLPYFIFWFLVCLISIITTSVLTVIVKDLPKLFLYEGIILVAFNIIHLIPLLALIRRRLNDIVPNKAKLIFSGVLLCYLIQLSVPVILFTQKTVIADNPVKFLTFIPYVICAQLCALLVTGTVIYLMCKKGELTLAALDKQNSL